MARTHSLKLLLFALTAILCLNACRSKKIVTDASGLRGVPITGTLEERYSTLLNVPKNDIKNTRLYKFIDTWMGVPHRTGGTDRGGIDCSGFTNLLQREIYRKSLPRTASQMATVVKREYEEDLQEGDLVFFNFYNKFDHVGVYLKNNKFVHVSTKRGVIISDLKDPWYYKSFSRCGKIF